jgi:lipase
MRSMAPLHGTTSSSRAWLAVARALSGRAALLALDLRGRGASDALPGPYGLEAHVADVLWALEVAGLERAVIVGHSLGAYIAIAMAGEHRERVEALVLVDGGLPIPGSEGIDPQEFAAALLGPALARLELRFADREEYRDWWRSHPALSGSDAEDADVAAYADHDLRGEAPEWRSRVRPEAVAADAESLARAGDRSGRLALPATLLTAERGLRNEPSPMQPIDAARLWAAGDGARREARLVPGVNHYTITLGARGAAAVADAIVASLSPRPTALSG